MAKRKKKKKNIKPYLLLALVLAVFLSYIIYTYMQQREAKFAVYPGFGISLPLGYEIHGIDISKHNGYIFWPAVASMKEKDVQLGFVFMKATEGTSLVDVQFKRNWKMAKEQNMVRGAYHFFLSSRSGADQAKNFLKTVTLSGGDLPPVLDIEELHRVSPAEMRRQLQVWLDMVEKACGAKPIIYTNVDFYKNYLEGYFNKYPLWVAHYFAGGKPATDAHWVFWQHNDGGKVNGIRPAVDFNVFKGDSADFKKLLLKRTGSGY